MLKEYVDNFHELIRANDDRIVLNISNELDNTVSNDSTNLDNSIEELKSCRSNRFYRLRFRGKRRCR